MQQLLLLKPRPILYPIPPVVVFIDGYTQMDFGSHPVPGVQVMFFPVEAGGIAQQQLPAEIPAQQHVVLAPFLTGGFVGPVGICGEGYQVLDIAAVDPQFVQTQGVLDGVFHIRQEGHLEPGIHQTSPGIVPQAGVVGFQGQEPLQGVFILGRITGQFDHKVVEAERPAGLGQDIVLSQTGKGRHVHIGHKGPGTGPVDFPEPDVERSAQIFQPAAPVHPDAAVDLGEGRAAHNVELAFQPQVHKGCIVQMEIVPQVHVDIQSDVRISLPEWRTAPDTLCPV